MHSQNLISCCHFFLALFVSANGADENMNLTCTENATEISAMISTAGPAVAEALQELDYMLSNYTSFHGFGIIQKMIVENISVMLTDFGTVVSMASAFVPMHNSTELYTVDESFRLVYDQFPILYRLDTTAALGDIESALDTPYMNITANLSNIRRQHLELMDAWKTRPVEFYGGLDDIESLLDKITRDNAVSSVLVPCVENRTDKLFAFFNARVTNGNGSLLEQVMQHCEYDLLRFNAVAKLMMLHALEALVYESICTAVRFPGADKVTVRKPILERLYGHVAGLAAALQTQRANIMYTFHEHQLEKDIKNVLDQSTNSSKKEVAKRLHAHLSKKFGWFQWSVIVYKSIEGDQCHAYTGSEAHYVLLGYAQWNVIVAWNHQDDYCRSNCTIAYNRANSEAISRASETCEIAESENVCSQKPAVNLHCFVHRRLGAANMGNLLLAVNPDCTPDIYYYGNVVQHVVPTCGGVYDRLQCHSGQCNRTCQPADMHIFHSPVFLKYDSLESGDKTAYEEARSSCCLCEKERQLPYDNRSLTGLASCS